MGSEMCIRDRVIPLLQDQGILRRPFPVSVSDVFVIKSELEDWLERGNKKNKIRTKKFRKTKYSKSKEVQNIFSRALKKLRKNNNGEDPTYKEVWDTVYDEYELSKENNLGGGLPPRSEYDENEYIEYIESSDKPKPSLGWYIDMDKSSGTYHLKSLPSLLTKLKKKHL